MLDQEKRTDSVASTTNPQVTEKSSVDSIVTESFTDGKSKRGGKREGAGRKKKESEQDFEETNIFDLDKYPKNGKFKPCIPNDTRSRWFAAVVYPDSAPEDWREQLRLKGLRYEEGYHTKDSEYAEDGTEQPKKPHWHMLIDAGTNSATAKGMNDLIRPITHGTYVINIKHPYAYHRYLSHLDNHDKYPYYADPEFEIHAYNGFTVPDEEDRKSLIQDLQYKMLTLREPVIEYASLLTFAMTLGEDYYTEVTTHTILWGKVCDSYRNMGKSARNKERFKLWQLQNNENPFTDYMEEGEIETEEDTDSDLTPSGMPKDLEIELKKKKAELKAQRDQELKEKATEKQKERDELNEKYNKQISHDQVKKLLHND